MAYSELRCILFVYTILYTTNITFLFIKIARNYLWCKKNSEFFYQQVCCRQGSIGVKRTRSTLSRIGGFAGCWGDAQSSDVALSRRGVAVNNSLDLSREILRIRELYKLFYFHSLRDVVGGSSGECDIQHIDVFRQNYPRKFSLQNHFSEEVSCSKKIAHLSFSFAFLFAHCLKSQTDLQSTSGCSHGQHLIAR